MTMKSARSLRMKPIFSSNIRFQRQQILSEKRLFAEKLRSELSELIDRR